MTNPSAPVEPNNSQMEPNSRAYHTRWSDVLAYVHRRGREVEPKTPEKSNSYMGGVLYMTHHPNALATDRSLVEYAWKISYDADWMLQVLSGRALRTQVRVRGRLMELFPVERGARNVDKIMDAHQRVIRAARFFVGGEDDVHKLHDALSDCWDRIEDSRVQWLPDLYRSLLYAVEELQSILAQAYGPVVGEPWRDLRFMSYGGPYRDAVRFDGCKVPMLTDVDLWSSDQKVAEAIREVAPTASEYTQWSPDAQ